MVPSVYERTFGTEGVTDHEQHNSNDGENEFVIGLALVTLTFVQAQSLRLTSFRDIFLVHRHGVKVAREVSGATYHNGRMWVVDNEDDQNLLVMEENGTFSSHPLATHGGIADLEGITSDRNSLYLMAGGRSEERRVGKEYSSVGDG